MFQPQNTFFTQTDLIWENTFFFEHIDNISANKCFLFKVRGVRADFENYCQRRLISGLLSLFHIIFLQCRPLVESPCLSKHPGAILEKLGLQLKRCRLKIVTKQSGDAEQQATQILKCLVIISRSVILLI